MTTKIIYIIGRPGTGKYTISTEISKNGYILCDNHLINNPILSLIEHDGLRTIPDEIWNAIEPIRDVVFDFIAREPNRSYVLTNVLYESDHKIFEKVNRMASLRGSIFIPVNLRISPDEHVKRIQNIERLSRYKTINVNEVYDPKKILSITHPNLIDLDVSNLSAAEAASEILSKSTALVT